MSVVIHIPGYHELPGGGYELDEAYKYTCRRTRHTLTLEPGMFSDGATYAYDIISAAWWAHDGLCALLGWDDSVHMPSNWDASNVLHDILEMEGRWARAEYWRLLTYLQGGTDLKEYAEQFKDKLDGPCRWCGYDGPFYFRASTHRRGCPWAHAKTTERMALLRSGKVIVP